MDQCGPKWPNMDQCGPIWPKMAQAVLGSSWVNHPGVASPNPDTNLNTDSSTLTVPLVLKLWITDQTWEAAMRRNLTTIFLALTLILIATLTGMDPQKGLPFRGRPRCSRTLTLWPPHHGLGLGLSLGWRWGRGATYNHTRQESLGLGCRGGSGLSDNTTSL